MWGKIIQQGIKQGSKAVIKKGIKKGLEYSLDEQLFGIKEANKGEKAWIQEMNEKDSRVMNGRPEDWTDDDVMNAMNRGDYWKNEKLQNKVRRYFEIHY